MIHGCQDILSFFLVLHTWCYHSGLSDQQSPQDISSPNTLKNIKKKEGNTQLIIIPVVLVVLHRVHILLDLHSRVKHLLVLRRLAHLHSRSWFRSKHGLTQGTSRRTFTPTGFKPTNWVRTLFHLKCHKILCHTQIYVILHKIILPNLIHFNVEFEGSASSPVTRIVLSAMHTALGVLEN